MTVTDGSNNGKGWRPTEYPSDWADRLWQMLRIEHGREEVKAVDLVVLRAEQSFMRDPARGHRCHPSAPTLAKVACLHDKTVRKSWKRLEHLTKQCGFGLQIGPDKHGAPGKQTYVQRFVIPSRQAVKEWLDRAEQRGAEVSSPLRTWALAYVERVSQLGEGDSPIRLSQGEPTGGGVTPLSGSKVTPLSGSPKNSSEKNSQKRNKTIGHPSTNDRRLWGGYFDSEFWPEYPRKTHKGEAKKAWSALPSKPEHKALTPDDLCENVLVMLKVRQSGEWAKRDTDTTPYPATFLRGEMFDTRTVNAAVDGE